MVKFHAEMGTNTDDTTFGKIKLLVSEWFDKRETVNMKLLYKDHINNVAALDKCSKMMDFINLLVDSGHLSLSDPTILYDTIVITEQFGLVNKLKSLIADIPNLGEHTIAKFKPYRQMLVKLGMKLSEDDVEKIKDFYSLKKCKDSWNLILDLEHKMIICEENMTEFISQLKELKLPQAVKVLAEGAKVSVILQERSDNENRPSPETDSDGNHPSLQKPVNEPSNAAGNKMDEAIHLIKALNKNKETLRVGDMATGYPMLREIFFYYQQFGFQLENTDTGSLIFHMFTYDPNALRNLWKMHQSGKLLNDLGKILVSEDNLLDFKERWNTMIDEQQYKEALIKLEETGMSMSAGANLTNSTNQDYCEIYQEQEANEEIVTFLKSQEYFPVNVDNFTMADHRQDDKSDKFRREVLESLRLDLDDKTIDVLITLGYEEGRKLRHLPESFVMSMDCLTPAQKFTLIEEIKEKFQEMPPRNVTSTDAKDVELKWSAHLSKTKEGPMPTNSSSKHQHSRTREEYIERIINFCNLRLNPEITKEITEAEDALQETGFKLEIGCRISSRYKYTFDTLSLPVDAFENERAFFSHLRDHIFGLVTDCNKTLREMRVYSNDSLAKWVELFFEFFERRYAYESGEWQKMLTTGQTLVYDIPKGINTNGCTTVQIYIQLIVMLIKKAMTTYKKLRHADNLGHLWLSSMYLTMTKSSLLNSKWYTNFRHDAYQRNVINLGLCIMNGVITADGDVYQGFKDMKRTLDKLTIDCQKLGISTGSPEDRDEVNKIFEVIEQTRNSQTNDMPINDGHFNVDVIGTNEDVCRLVASAINSYNIREFEKMTLSLDEAEIFDTCKIRLSFAAAISTGFRQTFDFSNNIPESHGIEVVHNETYTNLDNLTNDHAKIVMYMGEVGSTDFRSLVDFLFTVADIRPYTNEWNHLMNKARAVVEYFQSLSKAGQCVTKCYVLLFLTVLHNFIATRNRLYPTEHYKLLPFVFACIPFCESELVESDVWIKTRFEVYEISILVTRSSLAAGQIPYAHWFPDQLAIVNELDTRANKLSIVICTQKQQLQKAKTDAEDLWAGSGPRMCISAALLYYRLGYYKGMVAVLKATDQTKDAKDIRMNFAMRLSAVFETCVDEHNRVGEASSLGNLLENAKCVLEWVSEDHSSILKGMGLKNSNCLLIWVQKLFGIIDNKQTNSFTCSAWKESEKQSLIAAKCIKKLSKAGRCISQAYLSFLMSYCLNFIARRHSFINDDFMTELQVILSVIKLCKDAFETSNFSIWMKSRACGLAALLFTRITETNEYSRKVLKEVIEMENEYKLKTEEYEEILCKDDTSDDVLNRYSEEINKDCKNPYETQSTEQVQVPDNPPDVSSNSENLNESQGNEELKVSDDISGNSEDRIKDSNESQENEQVKKEVSGKTEESCKEGTFNLKTVGDGSTIVQQGNVNVTNDHYHYNIYDSEYRAAHNVATSNQFEFLKSRWIFDDPQFSPLFL